MKLLIRALLTLVCFGSVVHAESPLAFCERVGAVIDRQERDYFLLFPGQEDFYSAEVFKTVDGGVSFEIRTGQDSLRKIEFLKVNQTVLNALAHYISDFESILYGDEPYDFITLSGWVGLAVGTQKPRRGSAIEIKTRRGEYVEGRLFCALDSAIVVSPKDYKFSPQMAHECRTIPFADINELQLGNSHPKSGIYAGALIGIAALLGLNELSGNELTGNTTETLVIGAVAGSGIGALLTSFKKPSALWLGGSLPTGDQRASLNRRSGTHAIPPELLPKR